VKKGEIDLPQPLLKECDELTAILVTIINRAKQQ
jgi:hypothetical protein